MFTNGRKNDEKTSRSAADGRSAEMMKRVKERENVRQKKRNSSKRLDDGHKTEKEVKKQAADGHNELSFGERY